MDSLTVFVVYDHVDPADLQVLFAARLPHQLGALDKHYTEFYAIHCVFSGHVDLRIGEQRWHLDGHWLWTGYPGPRIAFASSGEPPLLHWRIALSGERLATWQREGLWPEGPMQIYQPETIQACMDYLLSCMDGDHALASRRRANAVEALLLDLHRQQTPQVEPPTWILDLQNYLQKSWQKNPDYSLLARRYHMPLSTLRKNFQRHCGEALHTWFLRQRHREAQRLLLESNLKLGDIAEACGYTDQAWFTRQFTRFAGMSPLHYRRAHYV